MGNWVFFNLLIESLASTSCKTAAEAEALLTAYTHTYMNIESAATQY